MDREGLAETDLDLNLGRVGPRVMSAQFPAWATRVPTLTFFLAATQVVGGFPLTEHLEQQVCFSNCRRALEFTRPAVLIGRAAVDRSH